MSFNLWKLSAFTSFFLMSNIWPVTEYFCSKYFLEHFYRHIFKILHDMLPDISKNYYLDVGFGKLINKILNALRQSNLFQVNGFQTDLIQPFKTK